MSLIKQARSPLAKAKLECIVFALAEDSKKQLFPLFAPQDFPPMEYHWVDISSMNAKGWEEALSEIKPNVLVTGWKSFAIPESFSRRPDRSLRYVCHLTGSVRQVVPRHLIERGVL